MTDRAEFYADRESIHPRAFALRHMVIEEVKSRKRSSAAARHPTLDRVARGVDVSYDGATRAMVVRFESAEIRRVPLDELPLYHRGDLAAAEQERDADPRRWDVVLEANRRLAGALVDAMVAKVAGA